MTVSRTCAALTLLLTLLGGVACVRPGQPPVKNAPPSTKPEQKSTLPPEEPDEDSTKGEHLLTVKDLAPIGTTSLESVGTEESLLNPSTITDALAVIDNGLKAADPADRFTAIEGLGSAPWEDARPRLLAATRDSDPQVAMDALSMLSLRADSSLQPDLEPYLSWGNLWRKGPNHPAFIPSRSDPDNPMTPEEALAKLKDPKLIPVIHGLLTAQDDNDKVIQGIRLADLYGPATFESELAAIFNNVDPQSPRYTVAKVLLRAKINVEQNERYLKKALNPASEDANAVIPALNALKAAADLKKTEWVPEIRALLKSPIETMRGQAVMVLGQMGQPLSDAEWGEAIGNVEERSVFVDSMYRFAPKSVIPMLWKALDPAVRDTDDDVILITLSKLGDPKAFDELYKSSQQKLDGKYTSDAIRATEALAILDDERVIPVLRDILNDTTQPVRRQYLALQGIGRLRTAADLPTLVRYYRNFRDAQPGLAAYAAAIALSLAKPGTPTTQAPGDRLIWPLLNYGRFAPLYGRPAWTQATIDAGKGTPAKSETGAPASTPPGGGTP